MGDRWRENRQHSYGQTEQGTQLQVTLMGNETVQFQMINFKNQVIVSLSKAMIKN